MLMLVQPCPITSYFYTIIVEIARLSEVKVFDYIYGVLHSPD